MTRLPAPDSATLPAGIRTFLATLPPDAMVQMMSLSAGTVKTFVALAKDLFTALELPPRSRELVILAVAEYAGAAFVTAQHAPMAAAAGVDERTRELIAGRRLDDPALSPYDSVLLRFAAEAAARPRVDDLLFQQARAHLSDRELVEVLQIVGEPGRAAAPHRRGVHRRRPLRRTAPLRPGAVRRTGPRPAAHRTALRRRLPGRFLNAGKPRRAAGVGARRQPGAGRRDRAGPAGSAVRGGALAGAAGRARPGGVGPLRRAGAGRAQRLTGLRCIRCILRCRSGPSGAPGWRGSRLRRFVAGCFLPVRSVRRPCRRDKKHVQSECTMAGR
ncbi:alkylhydroperoxidase family enzyme [Catenulispora sp. GP43]